MKILLATRNKDKIRELRRILSGLELEIRTTDDYPGLSETIEDGDSFAENALKKAREAAEFAKIPALADDSGLEVDYLGGAPGIYAARYAGPDCTYEDNNRKLLDALEGVSPEARSAKFVCVAALVIPEETEITRRGEMPGRIAEKPRGEGGFGYDPIFLLPDGRTVAEISAGEKSKISHRAESFGKMRSVISELIEKTP